MVNVRGSNMFFYIVFSCVGIGAVIFLYNYFEKVRKVKNRLKILGVPAEKLKGGLSHLEEILYDKEMELSEESFLISRES